MQRRIRRSRQRRQTADTAVDLETGEPAESALPRQPAPVSDEQPVATIDHLGHEKDRGDGRGSGNSRNVRAADRGSPSENSQTAVTGAVRNINVWPPVTFERWSTRP